MRKQIGTRILSVGLHLLIAYSTLFVLSEIEGYFGRFDSQFTLTLSLPLAFVIAVIGGNTLNKGLKRWLIVLFCLGLALVLTLIWLLLFRMTLDFVLYNISVSVTALVFFATLAQLLFLEMSFSKGDLVIKRIWLLLLTPVIVALSVGLSFGLTYSGNELFELYNQPSSAKIDEIMKADDIYIEYKFYGGIGGYGETNYHFTRQKYDTLVIIEEGTDFQNYQVLNQSKFDLLERSLKNSLELHDPKAEMSGSCSHFSRELYVRGGLTMVHLKPTMSDTIFNTIFDENE